MCVYYLHNVVAGGYQSRRVTQQYR
jgi:hypothetical protein